jgi:hypothetical protein
VLLPKLEDRLISMVYEGVIGWEAILHFPWVQIPSSGRFGLMLA